eukprot:9485960-Pyramimonas_sp.AAC.1
MDNEMPCQIGASRPPTKNFTACRKSSAMPPRSSATVPDLGARAVIHAISQLKIGNPNSFRLQYTAWTFVVLCGCKACPGVISSVGRMIETRLLDASNVRVEMDRGSSDTLHAASKKANGCWKTSSTGGAPTLWGTVRN